MTDISRVTQTDDGRTRSPLVWIVVLNWNRLDDTLHCVASLRNLEFARYRILVVDNGSTDGSVSALQTLPGIDLLVNEDNHRHLAVDVTGLTALNDRTLSLLYGDETANVSDGRLLTRLQPFDVKLFCTSGVRFQTRRPNVQED